MDHLDSDTVLSIASHIGLDDGAFLIGGQAFNFWAEYYSSQEELEQYRPYTSKDIDYFGTREAAEKLARALNGTVKFPSIDNATPQTAIVEASINGQNIIIDFLGNVLGVRPNQLHENIVEILVPCQLGSEEKTITIPLMHPLHCLQSRYSNIIALGRADDTAKRQAEAAPIVLREYLNDSLNDGLDKEVTKTLQSLFDYLSKDINGKKAHKYVTRDPIEIIEAFINDERIDNRFRNFNMQSMIEKLKAQRK